MILLHDLKLNDDDDDDDYERVPGHLPCGVGADIFRLLDPLQLKP